MDRLNLPLSRQNGVKKVLHLLGEPCRGLIEVDLRHAPLGGEEELDLLQLGQGLPLLAGQVEEVPPLAQLLQ